MNITVLGAGLVGSAIIKDLAPEHRVLAVDMATATLEPLAAELSIQTVQADLREPGTVEAAVADSDLVICAVPGFLGYDVLARVVHSGKDCVDISFFREDPFTLDELAREQEVTAVVDCGVAPGLCNIILGYMEAQLEQVERYSCYVGGLPRVRQWPYEYKAVFSPSDVIEEYVRPARQIEHGQEVVYPALSQVELLDFPGVGTLEAFNTDGLRTLRHTMAVPFMKEKTLRYPGHANLMRVFRESGFFDPAPIEVDGQMVSPLQLTSRLLFEQWRLEEGEEDMTVMQVLVEGRQAGERVRHEFYLLDFYDRDRGITSMARTTGYTCALVVRMLLEGRFRQHGICPPEFIGRTQGCYETLLEGYAARGIRLAHTVRQL
ncbi:MAG: saccharopine dehydrogenase [Caldilineae bacterium]|nr:MAG: saccharopine dehydrogenase [Caldilineae bacterium]